MKTGKVEGKFTTGSHTGVMIPVFAYGPGAENFSGMYENNEIFHKMMSAFRFKTNKTN
jgi:alkaline phosphatase